jgi:hypothetical protein
MNEVTPEKENQHDGPSEKKGWLGGEPQCLGEVSGIFDPSRHCGKIHCKNEAKQGSHSYSGTEALARVMVEAESEEKKQAAAVADAAALGGCDGDLHCGIWANGFFSPDSRAAAARSAPRRSKSSSSTEGRVISRDGTALHETAGPPDKLGPECKGL